MNGLFPDNPCNPPAARRVIEARLRAAGMVSRSMWALILCDMQTVDLLEALGRRGVKYSTACAFLDAAPPLAVSVWVRVGYAYRGTQLEGYSAVVLDNGNTRGTFMQEGGGLQLMQVVEAEALISACALQERVGANA